MAKAAMLSANKALLIQSVLYFYALPFTHASRAALLVHYLAQGHFNKEQELKTKPPTAHATSWATAAPYVVLMPRHYFTHLCKAAISQNRLPTATISWLDFLCTTDRSSSCSCQTGWQRNTRSSMTCPITDCKSVMPVEPQLWTLDPESLRNHMVLLHWVAFCTLGSNFSYNSKHCKKK